MSKVTTSILLIVFSICCALSFPASSAQADTPVRACQKDALQTFNQAVNEAKSDLKIASATCKYGPVIAACRSTCFQNFKTCLQPVYDSLASCRSSCGDNFIAAREDARVSLGCGTSCGANAAYQKAVIGAQLSYYSCRLTCRATPASVDARAACRVGNSTCVKACS